MYRVHTISFIFFVLYVVSQLINFISRLFHNSSKGKKKSRLKKQVVQQSNRSALVVQYVHTYVHCICTLMLSLGK